MHTALSSYVLVGIVAVAVRAVVNEVHVKVVEAGTGRCVRSVKPPAPGAGTALAGSGVQVPLRKRVPAQLNTTP